MKFLKIFAELTMGRVVILAVFVAVGYYFSYFDAGGSIEEETGKVNSMISAEEARRVEINKLLKKEEEMRGNVLQLQRNLEVVKSRIPNELKDSQMQELINGAAKSSGVNVTKLAASASVPRDVKAPPIKIKPADLKPENLIEEVKFKITLDGSFEAFLKFLDTLAKEDKVIKIRNFTISKNLESDDEENVMFDGEIIGFKQANIEIDTGQGAAPVQGSANK
ncbi:MAG: hypothetical protein ACXWPX_08655 [Pseudobdellovibrio sp.]